MVTEKRIFEDTSIVHLSREKSWTNKKSPVLRNIPRNTKRIVYKNDDLIIDDWDNVARVNWKRTSLKKSFTRTSEKLQINSKITLDIPTNISLIKNVFLDAVYILKLEDDWDDEGGSVYDESFWEMSAVFLINYFKWIRNIYEGNLYYPKMYHGPNGTFDFVWNESNFRLFINIDYSKNKGSFYTDSKENQYSEGEFTLNKVKYNLLPFPIVD
jgi:hypothetical protein